MFCCFPFLQKKDPVKSLVTQGHVKCHTPLRFKPRPLIGNRTNLRSHLHWLTLYLTEVRNVCIFAGLSDCLPKEPKRYEFTCFCFYCKMSSYKRVVNLRSFFDLWQSSGSDVYVNFWAHFCLSSQLLGKEWNVSLWKIK